MISLTPAFLGWLSLAIAVASYAPYFKSILSGNTRPHAFSWFIWGLLTGIAFFVQDVSGAGPGAWVTGFTAVIALGIALLSLFKGEKNITRSDWITFIAALAVIPVWYGTQDPLYAVILIALIDGLGFYPTFRKSWSKPQEELLIMYYLSALKFAIALLALDQFTPVTALYPASIIFLNLAFIGMIHWRRRR